MKHNSSVLYGLASVLAICFTVTPAQSADNFNDGNDNGWTRYEPLAPHGAPGTFTFPIGPDPLGAGYRIQAPASPDPATLGPARAGSFRLDDVSQPGQTFLLGTASIVLTDWDNAISQSFGVMGFVRELGLGTLDGYLFSYSTSGLLSLSRMDNEELTTLATASLSLDPSLVYRFNLDLSRDSIGTFLTGTVYERHDLLNPISFMRTLDSTSAYSSGFNGLYLWNDDGGPVDATFDQFEAGVVPEPSTLSILGLAGLSGLWFARRRRISSR